MFDFGHIELFVRDASASKAFYRDILGFKVTVEQGAGLVWIQKGNLEILLRKGRPPAESARYEDAQSGLVLYTKNLNGAVEHLRAHGVVIRGTVDTENCFTFTDLDNNWFQLVDPDHHDGAA